MRRIYNFFRILFKNFGPIWFATKHRFVCVITVCGDNKYRYERTLKAMNKASNKFKYQKNRIP